jgi:hypothetical protein
MPPGGKPVAQFSAAALEPEQTWSAPLKRGETNGKPIILWEYNRI